MSESKDTVTAWPYDSARALLSRSLGLILGVVPVVRSLWSSTLFRLRFEICRPFNTIVTSFWGSGHDNFESCTLNFTSQRALLDNEHYLTSSTWSRKQARALFENTVTAQSFPPDLTQILTPASG